jgi:hypothetical protein
VFHRRVAGNVFVQEAKDMDNIDGNSCYISRYGFEKGKLTMLARYNLQIEPVFRIKGLLNVEVLKFSEKVEGDALISKDSVIFVMNTEKKESHQVDLTEKGG